MTTYKIYKGKKSPCNDCNNRDACSGTCEQWAHWFRWAWKKAALPFRRVQADKKRMV